MQTGMDESGRKAMLDSLMAGPALKGSSASPQHTCRGEEARLASGGNNLGEESVHGKSAMFGMRMALPIALCLWALIAALIWAWHS